MKRRSDASDASRAHLTPSQRAQIERAREVAAADAHQLAEPKDFRLGDGFVHGVALGVARQTVAGLLDIIDELTGGAS